MAHTIRDKKKLLNRVRRIRGQLEAIERGIEAEKDCDEMLQIIAACRGAINGLMAEVIEGHVRYHVVDPDDRQTNFQTGHRRPKARRCREDLFEVTIKSDHFPDSRKWAEVLPK